MTRAGRSTRSPKWYPCWTTSMTMARLDTLARQLAHRLVEIGIELGSQGLHGFDALVLQHAPELLEDQFDALAETVRLASIGSHPAVDCKALSKLSWTSSRERRTRPGRSGGSRPLRGATACGRCPARPPPAATSPRSRPARPRRASSRVGSATSSAGLGLGSLVGRHSQSASADFSRSPRRRRLPDAGLDFLFAGCGHVPLPSWFKQTPAGRFGLPGSSAPDRVKIQLATDPWVSTMTRRRISMPWKARW